MIEAVIFDKDGVLIDSIKTHFEAWRLALQKAGKDYTWQEFSTVIGQSSSKIAQDFIKINKLSVDSREIEADKHQIYLQLSRGKLQSFSGVEEILQDLKQRSYKLALASSDPFSAVEDTVKSFNWQKFFQVYIGGDQVARQKPAPDLFLKAALSLSVEVGNCLVVEDTPSGIEAAKAAKMRVVAVTHTYPKEKLVRADFIIDKIVDLKEALVEIGAF